MEAIVASSSLVHGALRRVVPAGVLAATAFVDTTELKAAIQTNPAVDKKSRTVLTLIVMVRTY